MKRRDLERALAEHGCEVLREGSNQAIWGNSQADQRAPIPRHPEIPAGTARTICRQLLIPPPVGVR